MHEGSGGGAAWQGFFDTGSAIVVRRGLHDLIANLYWSASAQSSPATIGEFLIIDNRIHPRKSLLSTRSASVNSVEKRGHFGLSATVFGFVLRLGSQIL